MISEQASIHSTAKIADNVTIGPWSLIGPNVSIGEGTVIGSHAIIQEYTRIGRNNKISSYSLLGGDPQDISYNGEPTWLELGDNNVIREYVSIHRGSLKEDGVTVVGSNNLIFAYSHIAHDCVIGDGVTFFNNATLAGHCRVDDNAVIGAFSAVHQFCHIGQYSFLARAAQVPKNVPPYLLVVNNPAKPCGLNIVGLKRAGFSLSIIRQLKKAYSVLYQQNLPLSDALNELKSMSMDTPEISNMVALIESSSRGIVR